MEYNSLGTLTRTGHLVDDLNSNTYRALRFFGSKEHGNTLYAEFTGASLALLTLLSLPPTLLSCFRSHFRPSSLGVRADPKTNTHRAE